MPPHPHPTPPHPLMRSPFAGDALDPRFGVGANECLSLSLSSLSLGSRGLD